MRFTICGPPGRFTGVRLVVARGRVKWRFGHLRTGQNMSWPNSLGIKSSAELAPRMGAVIRTVFLTPTGYRRVLKDWFLPLLINLDVSGRSGEVFFADSNAIRPDRKFKPG